MVALILALVLTRMPPDCNELQSMHRIADHAIAEDVHALETWSGPRDEAYDRLESQLLHLLGLRDDIETLQDQQNCSTR